MLHLNSPFQIASLSLLSALVVFSFPVNTSNFSYSKKAEPSQLMFWIASTNIPWVFIVKWYMQNMHLWEDGYMEEPTKNCMNIYTAKQRIKMMTKFELYFCSYL